ncbi:hypothetical protein GCM10023168_26020 [Fodinibacter luteus]|uniref:RDD domain-containing protein n=1 Tax=Fodinibacter luteus TaxID=552064 RepID=A0ABP8KK41_9MICO
MTGPDITVPREARPYQGESAGIVTRVVAATIDAVVVGVILGAGYLGWAAVIFLLDPLAFTFPQTNLLVSLTAGLFVATIYLWLAWWLLGRTYGAHIMGIRVSGRRGRRLGPLRALARAGFCVFFPIGLFWCAISPRRRSVQDVVLFTKVVYDWLPRPGGPGAHPAAGAHAPAGARPPTGSEPLAGAQPPAGGQPPVEGEPYRRHWPAHSDDPGPASAEPGQS